MHYSPDTLVYRYVCPLLRDRLVTWLVTRVLFLKPRHTMKWNKEWRDNNAKHTTKRDENNENKRINSLSPVCRLCAFFAKIYFLFVILICSLHCKLVLEDSLCVRLLNNRYKVNFGEYCRTRLVHYYISILVWLDIFGIRTHLESILWKTVNDN